METCLNKGRFFFVLYELVTVKSTISEGEYMIKRIKKNMRNSKLILFVYKHLFSILTLLPKNEKLIIFESFNGRQFSDNPRAIFEHLSDNGSNYRMVWAADRQFIHQFKGHDIEYAVRFSFKWLILMATAKYWVSNSRFPLWFRKSSRTVYLQTWHGTPLKKLGADMDDIYMPDTNAETYKKEFLDEAKKWDYLVSPNPYSTDIFKRAFGFTHTMIESGYPRNDFLITRNTPESIQQIKEKSHLPQDKKIILYAPTWRDDESIEKGKYSFDLQLNLEKMQTEFGEDYIILLRMHYLIAQNIDTSPFKGFVYDFSYYEDIRDLYLISDLLITDYSSVFFDYAILNKPILFYVYDIDKYRDKLRGFYFDFESDSPGPLVKTTEDVVKSIRCVESKGFLPDKKVQAFRKTFSSLEDGNASSRVVNEVFKKS